MVPKFDRLRLYIPKKIDALQPSSDITESKDIHMASSTIIGSCKRLDPKEEQVIDLDIGNFEIVLTLRNLTKIKNKLSQGPNLLFDSLCSSLFEVMIEPTFPLPNFIH